MFVHVKTTFSIGKLYDYYTNFGGLNHFVVDDYGEPYPFDGPVDKENEDIVELDDRRVWIYDYFMTPAEWRDYQIDNIIKEDPEIDKLIQELKDIPQLILHNVIDDIIKEKINKYETRPR